MCDGLKRAVDGAVGDVCLTSHSIDVGANYGRWTSLQAVFGETGSPRLLAHLLDVHDQFCTACTDKLRIAEADAAAVIAQSVRQDGNDTRDVGITEVHPASSFGDITSVLPGGSTCSTNNPGKMYILQAVDKTDEYSCWTEENKVTDASDVTDKVSSDVSNSDNVHMVSTRASPDIRPLEASYKVSDDTLICTPTDNENVDAKSTIKTENGYVYQTFTNEETDTSDTDVYGTETADTPMHPILCADTRQTYSCSTTSEDGSSMSGGIMKKEAFVSMDYVNLYADKNSGDRAEGIDNTDGCTSQLTDAEAVHISETSQYDDGSTRLNNTLSVTHLTINHTEAYSSRSMVNQDSLVYTQTAGEKSDTKLTTEDVESHQCETIDEEAEHDVTTREDYGVTGHHSLEMECETPEMEQDSKTYGQCYIDLSRSECLLHDHKERDDHGILWCKRCGKVLVNSQPELEYTAVKKKKPIAKYTCPECNETFSRQRLFKKHVRIHVRENGRKCDICEKVFSSHSSMKQHRRIHSDTRELACDVCHNTYKGKANLKIHMRIHETRERKFSCEQCGKSFYTKKLLNSHSRVHSDVKAHQCDTCGATFRHPHGLKQHVLSVHDNAKNFICEYCEKAFLTNSSLVSHKRTHTGERPFPCSTCGMRFLQKSSMMLHMRTHTGERPFSCTICDKSFTRSHHLVSHIRMHTGDRRFVCSTCGKRFLQKISMDIHMKRHTGELFVCSTCGKRFIQKRSMDIHMKAHTHGLLVCSTCGKRFFHKRSLDIHKKTHTGELPFSCITCGNTFERKQTMEIHMKLHTDDMETGKGRDIAVSEVDIENGNGKVLTASEVDIETGNGKDVTVSKVDVETGNGKDVTVSEVDTVTGNGKDVTVSEVDTVTDNGKDVTVSEVDIETGNGKT